MVLQQQRAPRQETSHASGWWISSAERQTEHRMISAYFWIDKTVYEQRRKQINVSTGWQSSLG